jgi:hypothetical protein
MVALLLVPPFVAVLTGAMLARQGAGRYWRWATGLTLALSVAFFLSEIGRDVPHAVLGAFILTGMSLTVPLLVTFAIQRMTATAPRWLAVGIGLLAYIPIVLVTVTLTMQLGEILAPLLPGIEIDIP